MNIWFSDVIDTNRIELGKIFSLTIRFVYGSWKKDAQTEVSFE